MTQSDAHSGEDPPAALQPAGDDARKASASEDHALMKAVTSGDRAAFETLLHKHIHRVHHFVQRSTNAAADTDDLVQETFLRVWSNAKTFKVKEASFSTWLMRIARNLCIDSHRRQQARPAGHIAENSEAQLHEMSDGARAPATALQHERELERLRVAISELPERQRTALTLCQLQGRSNAEAASILDIKVSAIESLLARARRSLHKVLAQPTTQSPASGLQHEGQNTP